MSIIRSSVIAFAIQLIIMFITIVNRFIFAKYLGPSDFGIYNLLTLVITVTVLFSSFGLGHSFSFFLSKGTIGVGKVISISTLLSLSIGSISVLITYGIFMRLFPNVDKVLILLMSTTTPFIMWVSLISYVFLGKQLLKDFYIFNASQIIFSLLFFIILLLLDGTFLKYSIFSWIFASFFSVILIILRLYNLKLLEFELINFKDIKEVVNYGFKMYLVSITNILNYRLDNFIVNYFLGAKSLGIYVMAVAFADAIGKISHTSSLVLFSRAPSLKGKQLNNTTPLLLKFTLLATILSILVLIVAGKQIINLLFNEQYNQSYYTVLYLIPGVLALCIFRILYHDLAGRNHAKYGTIGTILGLIVTLIFDFILIPMYGIKGAAVTSSIAYTTSCVFIIHMYLKITKIDIVDLLIIQPKEFNSYIKKLVSLYKAKRKIGNG
jgi:O-antigen/teichoic acid export membrane protein